MHLYVVFEVGNMLLVLIKDFFIIKIVKVISEMRLIIVNTFHAPIPMHLLYKYWINREMNLLERIV